MKILVFYLLLLVVGHSQGVSQDWETIRIKAGVDLVTAFSPYGFYRFPGFREGHAILKNGEKNTARFNYHIVNQEVQFIGINGDTLALAEPQLIKYIVIDTTLFYYAGGYLEVIVDHESVKLAKKMRVRTAGEKIGAYGQPSPAGSIETPSRVVLRNTGKPLNINQDIILRKEYTYHWLDKYGAASKATKSNLLKLLPPDHKNSMDYFLKNNNIDFNKEADLKKLLEYSRQIK